MKGGHDVNDRLADLASGCWLIPELPSPPLHHVERSADHAWILTEHVGAGREGKDRPEGVEYPVLARHVVGARRHRSERGPPHHKFVIAESKEVREIAVTAGELLYGERAMRIGEAAVKISSQGFF